MKNFTLFFSAFICLSSAITSCKKDQRTRWDTELLTPLAHTSMSLSNIVNDTSLVKTNAENYLTLAFKRTLYELNLANQVINIPDTSIGQKFLLDSLKLPNQIIEHRISLGFLAQNMLLSPDQSIQFLGQLLLLQNGN